MGEFLNRFAFALITDRTVVTQVSAADGVSDGDCGKYLKSDWLLTVTEFQRMRKKAKCTDHCTTYHLDFTNSTLDAPENCVDVRKMHQFEIPSSAAPVFERQEAARSAENPNINALVA